MFAAKADGRRIPCRKLRMYLRRLELYGFKTFAARTVLDFEHGVTAVVGPNGSGKSNLADAVRWALGEQNVRHVRCRQTEDLIFAGSSAGATRSGTRPAMNMAEVLLTLDNSSGWLPVDYTEVRIGRRAYRGGENEYLLNGARVRLRDITDLLARAAINAGDHLVIGQGLIDTVLSLRPEERRSLVENLAGLRFYYSRRDEAEVKLRAAEANLQHVEAMIAEAAPHLALLREQAAAYAQYSEVERDLRALLLLHYAQSHAAATERRGNAAAEVAAASAALEAARAAVRQADARLSATRERARLRGRDADKLRSEVRAAHERRESTERELAVGRARHEASAARLTELRAGLEELETRCAGAARDLAEADNAVRACEAHRAALQEQSAPHDRAVAAATTEAAAAEKSLRALDGRRREVEQQEAAALAELAALQREEAAAQEDERRLAMDEQTLATGLTAAEVEVAAARNALTAAETMLEARRSADAQARLLAAEAATRARQAEAEQCDATRRAGEADGRADGLRSWLAAATGGTADGAALAGTLIARPEFEPALAAALGPILMARSAGPDLDAGRAAAQLASGAGGILLPARAHLSDRAQDALMEALLRGGLAPENLAGWGDRLSRVETASPPDGPLNDALSTILVVRDVPSAWQAHLALARHPDGAALVTLATPDGDVLLPSGLLYRPTSEAATVLRRMRELRHAEAEAREMHEARSRADEAVRQANAENIRLSAAAEEALRVLRAAETERNARRQDLTAAERAAEEVRKQAGRAEERRRRAAEAATARVRRRAAIDERLHVARSGLAEIAREEEATAAGIEAARTAVLEATRRRAEHSAELAVAVERAAAAQRRRRASAETRSRLEGDVRARREHLARLEQEVRTLSEAEGALIATAGEVARLLDGLRAQLRPLEAELASLEAEAIRLETHLATLRPEEERCAAAHQAAALALQRAEHELDSVRAALEADLALAPDDLPAPGPPSPGLQGRVKALRARLAAFGAVNARAPEDLAAATERQDFLQAQAADLRDGIARLRALIGEANATVRERFGAVAGELDAQFRLYLQQLFGGGRGELTALYNDDGQPSGLEIAVQPPGKRTRELALLSGGERALVALALIFAMLAVRPVPFCLLDEAEAALDEANTLRVGEILRALSARTQFIVITHNRGTMSHADAMYGVTMAESGVSQVAGLHLAEVEAVRRGRALERHAGVGS